jgi:hypothetical protein
MQSNLRAHIDLGDSVLFAVFVFMALAVGGCAQPPTIVCDGPSDVCVCEYNSKYYAVGEHFMKECNTCTCGENGAAGCTKIGCEPPTQACGGLTGLSCPAGQYCDYPVEALCGAADATGTCRTPSENCDQIYKPVCSCDDEQFDNACDASHAGKSIAYASECRRPVCGGLRGAQCSDTEFCSYPPDAMCGRADATGTCQPRPEICTVLPQFVCGCNGETYTNECQAHAAGYTVDHLGACE